MWAGAALAPAHTSGHTTTEAAGCSCQQIILAQALGGGHSMLGCSISAMDDWVALVSQ